MDLEAIYEQTGDEEIILVEVPHQTPAKVKKTTKKEVFERAQESSSTRGDGFYKVRSEEDMLDGYGDEETLRHDLPDQALEILDEHGEVAFVPSGVPPQWWAPDEAPGPLQWAKEELMGEFHSINWFESVEDAIDYYECRNNTGGSIHQYGTIMTKLRKMKANPRESKESQPQTDWRP